MIFLIECHCQVEEWSVSNMYNNGATLFFTESHAREVEFAGLDG